MKAVATMIRKAFWLALVLGTFVAAGGAATSPAHAISCEIDEDYEFGDVCR